MIERIESLDAIYGAVQTTVKVVATKPNECKLELRTQHVLEGVVVGSKGKPYERAMVICSGDFLPTSGHKWIAQMATKAVFGGAVEFEVPHGRYRCVVQLSGHKKCTSEVIDTAGRTQIDLGTIRLQVK